SDEPPPQLLLHSALHSHFIVGSVSEENSEDEIQGKLDMQLEEKETRSLSPSSGSSDSTYEMGFDHIDGPIHSVVGSSGCSDSGSRGPFCSV
uniref:Uncharacterized protein n=1 Tax=Seriola lalandi dorsalis TaxID=1841481 RepID=A0A3B4XVB5_SERLL